MAPVSIGEKIGSVRSIFNRRTGEQTFNEKQIIDPAKPLDYGWFAAASAFDVLYLPPCTAMILPSLVTSTGCVHFESA